MREIKFRGKNFRGEWIYGDLVTSPNGLIPYIVQKEKENKFFMRNLEPIEVDADTVGQFIGLKDRDGKEIYEGDIVKTDIDGFIVKAVIVWHIDGFMMWIKYPPKGSGIPRKALFGLPRRTDVMEIIGNIYDNPELLED